MEETYAGFVAKGAWSAPEVTAAEAARMFQEARDAGGRGAGPSVVFVDVRSPDERGVSCIPGAIDKVEFERRLEDEGARATPAGAGTTTYICYCTAGGRGARGSPSAVAGFTGGEASISTSRPRQSRSRT